MKMKRLLSIALTLAMVLSLTACAGLGGSGDTKTVTDHNGNEVEVSTNAKRIVVCDIYPLPSVLSIFFDSASNIVGMPEESMTAAKNSLLSELYPDILNAETGFISGSDVNIEEVLKLKPDVVFYNASNEKLGENLRDAGLAALAVSVNKWDYDAIETLNHWIELFSEGFPDNDKTDIVKDYSSKVYKEVQSRVKDIPDDEREEVFFLFKTSDNAIITSGQNFFGQWWADAVGAKNVATELTQDNAVSVSLEQVYQWDPDKIIITNFTPATADDLYNNNLGNFDWSGLDAVANKEVYKMPLGMYRSYTPGVDTPITLYWLAKSIYPDEFKDIDIIQETKDYYKQVFGIELTDKQSETIFTPPAAAGAGF